MLIKILLLAASHRITLGYLGNILANNILGILMVLAGFFAARSLIQIIR